MRVIEACMEHRRNERVDETGDTRGNPLTNGIVRHDSHMQKFRSDLGGDRTWIALANRVRFPVGSPAENPPDDRRVFSGFSRLPRPFVPVLLYTHFAPA
ncbi:hypothetical protein PR048_033242 [Dryococelus australis]|uniref:Transposase n=1 Tax=Dryococelus australis TaxID=614101 RepID=A0ABQ9G2L0_9NEOP|nr:hypothetical protein PR048_033242 [Dryococelus australis]